MLRLSKHERMATVVQEPDLIEACRRGAPEAFRDLFDRYKDLVYTVAYRYSGEHAHAQDIAQETFLKVFVGIRNFRGESTLKSWLYRLTVNSCLDQKRRHRRLTPLLDEVLGMLQAPDLSALDDVLRAELSSHVRNVVADLSDEHRMLIVLRYTESLSYDEIAAIMNCSTGTIASRLSRIHKLLERRLARFAGRKGR
jgi:RNA polymerase sigma-70 factor (ECF subfamily)